MPRHGRGCEPRMASTPHKIRDSLEALLEERSTPKVRQRAKDAFAVLRAVDQTRP